MSWMQTYSGIKFNYEKINFAMIEFEDIAHQLSLINRFNGCTEQPYSVAQHSIIVMEQVPNELKLAALMHDAHEAYLGDISTPLSHHILHDGYDSLKFTIDLRIRIKFGINGLFDDPIVQDADLRVLATEAKWLMKPPPDDWNLGVEPYDFEIAPIDDYKKVEYMFLEAFNYASALQ